MSFLKHILPAALFAVSLVFATETGAQETQEKNPFSREISAVKRAEKRLQKAKSASAKKRAEANLKKEQEKLAEALKEETEKYEKTLKAVTG